MSTPKDLIPNAVSLPQGQLLRITAQSEIFKQAKGPGTAEYRKQTIGTKPVAKPLNWNNYQVFYFDLFRNLRNQTLKIGAAVFFVPDKDLCAFIGSDEAQEKIREFENIFKAQFNIDDTRLKQILVTWYQGLSATVGGTMSYSNSLMPATIANPLELACLIERRQDKTANEFRWEFGKDEDADGKPYIYFQVREKLFQKKDATDSNGFPIPGLAVTRYRCTQPDGGFEWMYTDVSNPLLAKLFTADEYPPFEITEAMKKEWRDIVAAEDALLDSQKYLSEHPSSTATTLQTVAPTVVRASMSKSENGSDSKTESPRRPSITPTVSRVAAPAPMPVDEYFRSMAAAPAVPVPAPVSTPGGFLSGVQGFLYGFAAGFVQTLQRAAAVFSPVAFGAGITAIFAPPVGAVIALVYLGLVAASATVGALVGGVAGAVYGARNGWPKDVGHLERIQTLGRHPFSGEEVTKDFQRQELVSELHAVPQPAVPLAKGESILVKKKREGSDKVSLYLRPPGVSEDWEPGMSTDYKKQTPAPSVAPSPSSSPGPDEKRSDSPPTPPSPKR